MPSLRMRLVAAYLHRVRQPLSATPDLVEAWIASPKHGHLSPRSVLRRLDVEERSYGVFRSYRLKPRGSHPGAALIYLHGGAYVSEMWAQHWTFVRRLAEETGREVEVPVYGLVPEYTYRDAFPFLQAVWDAACDRFSPDRIALAGDSAGAALALSLTQLLVKDGRPIPARLILISPWVDLLLSNPDVAGQEEVEPWLNAPALRTAGERWVDGDDPVDPLVSPLFGSMNGLPPMHLFLGTRELFYPDGLLLAQRAKAEGCHVTTHVEPGAVHIYPLSPTREGTRARRQIVAALRD